MTAESDGADAETCLHPRYGPLDLTCADCRRRGQARERKRRSRGEATGPDSPVPGLGGVTRQQVVEAWKAAAETRAALEDFDMYIEHCGQQKIEPSRAVQHAYELLSRNLIVLEGLGAVYRARSDYVYPPLPRA